MAEKSCIIIEISRKDNPIREFITLPKPMPRPTCFDAPEPDVKIGKTLTLFDKRVYIAAAALFNSGYKTITLAQIHKAISGSQLPQKEVIEKIEKSLKRMQSINVIFEVEQASRGNKTRYTYEGSLFPFWRAKPSDDIAQNAIRLFCEPPLITCARESERVVEIPQKAFSTLSKTDDDFRLEDYLMVRIARMDASENVPRTILCSDIYEKFSINTPKKQSNVLKKIEQYLNHFKKCEWIAGYSVE